MSPSAGNLEYMATLSKDPLPEVILHLGAGSCAELNTYLFLRPKRIVLVEANPDEARRLRQRVAAYDEVEVFSLAVSASDSLAKLNIYNISSCSSIRPATGLFRLFPGLRSQRIIEVETVAIADFVRQLKLDGGRPNWLVLDVPGEESELIRSLKSDGCIECFSRVTVHGSFISLYEGSSDVRSVLPELTDDGYELIGVDEHNDADLIVCHLQKNTAMTENLDLKRQLDEQIARTTKHEDVIVELIRELTDMRLERDAYSKEISEAKHQIDVLIREQQDRNEKIKELQFSYDRLREERASSEDVILAQRQEIERLISLSQETSRSLEQYKVRVADLKRELEGFRQTASVRSA